MLSLLGLPMMKVGMRGNMLYGGAHEKLFLFYHVIVAILFATLLFLAVVYLWKKIEMMDHDKDHHHNHK